MLELSGWSGHFENVIALFKEFSHKKNLQPHAYPHSGIDRSARTVLRMVQPANFVRLKTLEDNREKDC